MAKGRTHHQFTACCADFVTDFGNGQCLAHCVADCAADLEHFTQSLSCWYKLCAFQFDGAEVCRTRLAP